MQILHYANTHNSDMLYAVRVTVPDAFFYIDTGSKRYIFLDSREYGVFQDHNTQKDIECILLDPLLAEVADMPHKTGGANKLALLLIEKFADHTQPIRVSNMMPVDMADFLRAEGIQLDIVHSLFEHRAFKADWEKNAVKESLKRTHVAFERIEEVLRESSIVGDEIHYNDTPLTSEWLKREVEKAMLDSDLLNDEGIIISCGDHAAIPHHPGEGLLRPHQTIICDIFPRHRESGYYADMTRTYIKGTPSDEVRKMYDAVAGAQQAAIDAIAAGVSARSIHEVCVKYFEDAGFETKAPNGFVHGTGHGLGLDVHEVPFMNARTTETLQEGHVVTVEPGLYYNGIGGVRIEDVVFVTKNRAENLTQYPIDQWIIE